MSAEEAASGGDARAESGLSGGAPIAPPLRTLAPAKINLGLFVGPLRADGKHELVTAMQPVSLADELVLEPAADRDEVLCPGVAGENLAARAIELFRRASGWQGGPLRLKIDKRIPVAAGMGGGSADAGAALRLMQAASGLGDMDLLLELAAELGADVPAQVAPARTLAGGAGELLEALPDPFSPIGVLVLPAAAGLSTADVYAQADRMQPPRDARYLADRREGLRAALALGSALPGRALLANDLQDACQSLSPKLRRHSRRRWKPAPSTRFSAVPAQPSLACSRVPTAPSVRAAPPPTWPVACPRRSRPRRWAPLSPSYAPSVRKNALTPWTPTRSPTS